jgi:hypothetical protein
MLPGERSKARVLILYDPDIDTDPAGKNGEFEGNHA